MRLRLTFVMLSLAFSGASCRIGGADDSSPSTSNPEVVANPKWSGVRDELVENFNTRPYSLESHVVAGMLADRGFPYLWIDQVVFDSVFLRSPSRIRDGGWGYTATRVGASAFRLCSNDGECRQIDLFGAEPRLAIDGVEVFDGVAMIENGEVPYPESDYIHVWCTSDGSGQAFGTVELVGHVWATNVLVRDESSTFTQARFPWGLPGGVVHFSRQFDLDSSTTAFEVQVERLMRETLSFPVEVSCGPAVGV